MSTESHPNPYATPEPSTGEPTNSHFMRNVLVALTFGLFPTGVFIAWWLSDVQQIILSNDDVAAALASNAYTPVLVFVFLQAACIAAAYLLRKRTSFRLWAVLLSLSLLISITAIVFVYCYFSRVNASYITRFLE